MPTTEYALEKRGRLGEEAGARDELIAVKLATHWRRHRVDHDERHLVVDHQALQACQTACCMSDRPVSRVCGAYR